jgi:chromosome partitioning protein
MIVIFGGTKGGSGKSTLATSIVAIDITQGRDSLLLDADKQGSSAAWAATRETQEEVKRVPCIQKFGGLSLTRELEQLSKKYENIIVDAGGYDSEELRASLLAANRLYIPVKPGQFDLWALPRIIQIVKESRLYNQKLNAFFIINGANPNPRVQEVEEVKEATEEIEDIAYCTVIIRYRRAFQKAPITGLAVTELKAPHRDDKAIAEIMQFYEEVFHDNSKV